MLADPANTIEKIVKILSKQVEICLINFNYKYNPIYP